VASIIHWPYPQADLGELRFAEPKSTSFRLVNTGDVAATWRFIPGFVPGDAAAVAPAWLDLKPVEGRWGLGTRNHYLAK